MALSLAFSPHGHIIAEDRADAGTAFLPADEEAIRKALLLGDEHLLLWLAGRKTGEGLNSVAGWWRQVAGCYLTAFCQQGGRGEIAPPGEHEWLKHIDEAPVMRGGEYLSPPLLNALWQRLQACVQAAASHPSGEQGWMKECLPHWHMVGRVTLHLAENRKNLERPFAFLATYTSGLNAEGRPRHLPLQQAVKDSAGEKQRAALLHLLEPLSLAAGQSDWAREMLDSGEIYRPQAWAPGQALQFLRETPLFEHCGLAVRIPDWWKADAPPRPKVAITVGEGESSGMSGGSLLKFNIELSLDGEKLTPEELKALHTAEGLMLLKGRWVEVDARKLQAVLNHWQQARLMQFQGGMTFLQAMRLLAGAPLTGIATELPEQEIREWSTVHAGALMQERLAGMRDPARLSEFSSHPGLHATLRPYQAEGVNWLRFMTRLGLGACLADDMGLGKTIQVLALLLQIKRLEPDDGPSLLIAPASLLENWRLEAARFAPDLRVFIAHGSGDDVCRFNRYANGEESTLDDVDLVLTTYGMASRLKVLKDRMWRLLVLDEAQAIKNPGSAQTRSVKKLNARTRIALSGTPVENRLGDLWSLFDFINPGLLGSAEAFGRWVKLFERPEGVDYTPLRKLVRPYLLRRLKTDKSIIADLPDKTEIQAWCLLTRPQAILYQRAVESLAKTLAEVDKEARRGLVLSALTTFKQICNHPAQQSGDTHYDPELSGKFKRLRELCVNIAERQERVLIFTQFTEIVPALRELLRGIFGRDGLVLTGATRVQERRTLVDRFQNDEGPPFFILSLRAGGTGLTLTAASHVIHFDRWWNPAVENQATDRAYRIGQHRQVMVHKFICRGTLEEKIDRLITAKIGLADELMRDGSEISLTEMSDAELLDFVALDVSKTAAQA